MKKKDTRSTLTLRITEAAKAEWFPTEYGPAIKIATLTERKPAEKHIINFRTLDDDWKHYLKEGTTQDGMVYFAQGDLKDAIEARFNERKAALGEKLVEIIRKFPEFPIYESEGTDKASEDHLIFRIPPEKVDRRKAPLECRQRSGRK